MRGTRPTRSPPHHEWEEAQRGKTTRHERHAHDLHRAAPALDMKIASALAQTY